MRHASALAMGLCLSCAAPLAHAQAASTAPEGKILLELNSAVDTAEGGCQLTVVTTNRLDGGLKRAAWQVAIFDDAGVVQSLPILDFGAMIAGKTKVAVFSLPDRSCGKIGRIVINDVAECTGQDDSDRRAACLDGLTTQARTDIDFGI